MRIALCSDEPYPVHETIRQALKERGHDVRGFGACDDAKEHPWALAAERAALSVAEGNCAQGIFLCWTGTGISMAANKIVGIRAALCCDPGTAAGARVWNHANVLCLSNRTLSDDMAREMLQAWFDTETGDRGYRGVQLMGEVDARQRR